MGFFSRGRNTTNRADLIGDFQINTASYGEVVPEILGTTRVSGNIIDYEDFTAHEHKSTTRTGKGGGSKHTEITYTYTVAAAIGLCEGPIRGIGKVWRDKEVYEYPNEKIELTLFNGEAGQSPWPYMLSKHPEKALPYSGLAYMAGVVDLGDRGSLPQYNFEIMGKLLDTGDGVDVNPADYIVHVLQSIGADVTIEGLDHYRDYCKAADILISTPPDQKSAKAQQVINDIAEITNSLVFWSTDRLKIVPLADKPIGDWNPRNQIQYDLTADDLIPGSDGQLILYKRKDTSEAYNEATVEFVNRANSYEKETVSFEVVADVQKNGLKPASKKSALYLYTKARAQYYAEQLAMKRLYSKTQYTFRLDWAFCTLEVGDLVTLTDEACQLNKQIVVITAVNEASDGQLEFTAEGKPPGTYAPAKYDVHDNERPFVDYNASAPAVNDVAIFQTVGDVGGNQVFIGVNAPSGWGGCSVWISDNNENYSRIGSITQQARMGRTLAAIKADSTALNVRLNQGNMKSGTHIDAERANTLSWIDSEALSYEGAQLQKDGSYRLTNLVRGQYATTASDHVRESRFIRVDEAIFRYPYRKEDIGKTIYLKFTSMNLFGTNEQGLDEVQAYPYKIVPYYIPEVSNLALYTKYYDIGNGVKSFDVVAQFDRPQINSFDTVELWYRENNGNWKYGGSGDGLISISGCELGHTYEVKVVVKDAHGNTSQGVTKSIRVEMKAEIPNAPQGFSVSFSDMARFNWLEVRNADIDFYEVRLNRNAGQNDGLIGRSNNTTYSGTLQNRQATVYLYAHNPSKGYGAPAELTYNIPKPKRPSNVKATGNINGIGIIFDAVPLNCKGANVYVNDAMYFTPNSTLSVPIGAGIYSVYVAYVDMFGEGPRTDEILVTVRATIPKELLDREELGLSEIDRKIAAIDQVGNSTLDYAKAVQAMSRSPQLMDDPIFKNKFELTLYKRDNQEILQKFSTPSAQWGDIDIGGRLCVFYNANTDRKYTSIGYGGFRIMPKGRPLEGKLNGTYIVRMLAKVKPSITIHLNNNDLGTGPTSAKFLTSNRGTNKVDEYVFYWKYGTAWDPNNSNGRDCGYVYFKDVANQFSDKDWLAIIYRLEVYAVDEYDNSIEDIKSSITQLNSSITLKVENATTGLQSKITQLSDAVDSKISNESSKTSTSITQLDNAIKAQVITGDKVMSAITQYNGGTRIDGNLLHVTGQSLFDDNIITNKMIQANAVTADKMSVNSLSAISANLGVVNGGTINGGTITGATIKNKSGSFSVNDKGEIRGAHLTASTISAESIFNSGYKLKSLDFAVVTVYHGNYVSPISGYAENECVYIPVGYKFTNVENVDGSRADTLTSKLINNSTIVFNGGIPTNGGAWFGIGPTLKEGRCLAGLNHRRAIVQHYDLTSNDNTSGKAYLYTGVLYVLVIGKK
ncbi:phage tail protein [Veillonella caviae]|uniref:phage tail protein n=1 Tax=Veillonella caviae TaxID=248316 RepID=UPI002A91A1C4|nr:phage tail protein [Veillonella caviae]MDY6225017.1 phage tail protein [Veillonella caviae]